MTHVWTTTTTGRIARSTRLCALLLGIVMAVSLVGCSSKLNPTEPKDAYRLFRNALLKGNGDAVWKRCDKGTHDYFQQRYDQLVHMNKLIHQYLPQTDRRLARKQSGSILTDSVKDGKGLFLKIFRPSKLPKGEAYKLGMNIKELQVAQNHKTAKVTTRGGETFVLTRGPHHQWYVALTKSTTAVSSSFKWLDRNTKNLKKTIDDLINDERHKRETIIAELMHLKK